jgi:hypothetical protein
MTLPLEQDICGKINIHRQQLRTSALTSLDVLRFTAKCSEESLTSNAITMAAKLKEIWIDR